MNKAFADTIRLMKTTARHHRNTYSVWCSYKPGKSSVEVDDKLEGLAKKESDGSGFCMSDGMRDMDFSFKTLKEARAFATKAKKVKRGMKAEIKELVVWFDYEWKALGTAGTTSKRTKK